MKKFMVLTLSAAMVLSMAACGGSNSGTGTADTAAQSDAAETQAQSEAADSSEGLPRKAKQLRVLAMKAVQYRKDLPMWRRLKMAS